LSDPCFLLPTGFRLDHLALDGDIITAHLTAVSPTSACPTCGLT
jgi:hypothetical protein